MLPRCRLRDGHGGIPTWECAVNWFWLWPGEVTHQRQPDDRGDANRHDSDAALQAWIVGRAEDHDSMFADDDFGLLDISELTLAPRIVREQTH